MQQVTLIRGVHLVLNSLRWQEIPIFLEFKKRVHQYSIHNTMRMQRQAVMSTKGSNFENIQAPTEVRRLHLKYMYFVLRPVLTAMINIDATSEVGYGAACWIHYDNQIHLDRAGQRL